MSKDKKKVSEFLESLNYDMPWGILWYWDNIGNVKNNVIRFEDIKTSLESSLEFFNELVGFMIHKDLFKGVDRFSIRACRSGMICEIKEGKAYVEFDVFDNREGKYLFEGVAVGRCIKKGGVVSCIFDSVYLKPIK
jgi:hypothetical protein